MPAVLNDLNIFEIAFPVSRDMWWQHVQSSHTRNWSALDTDERQMPHCLCDGQITDFVKVTGGHAHALQVVKRSRIHQHGGLEQLYQASQVQKLSQILEGMS